MCTIERLECFLIMALPNIVEIIWHDLGDWLSCYGRSEIPSPNLQLFAEQGVVFENSFCTAPQCSPSRASIKTGRYPQSNGMMGLTHRGWCYREGEVDLPEILNKAGYSTYLFGFQHERHNTEDLTYNHVWRKSTHATDVAIEADRFFRGHAEADRPFFVSIGFQEVHRNFGSVYDKKLLDKIQIPGYLPDLEITRKDIASFYENIRIADSAVGRILQAVKDSGFEENTLIYFTTDHGAEFPRAKMTLYDPGIKTSLIMRYPRVIKAGMRVKDLVSHVDIMPTLLDAAGLEIPENVQGRSFWGLFTGETYIPRDEIFAQRTWHGGEYDPMRCIRTERYKYIRNWMPGWPVQMGAYVRRYGEEVINQFYSDVRPQEELYDLYNDEWEQVNVIDKDEYRDIRRDLSQRLYTFSEEINDPILQGHISRPKGGRVGYNCLWGKFPTREPETEDYRMSIVLLDDEYGDGPLVI